MLLIGRDGRRPAHRPAAGGLVQLSSGPEKVLQDCLAAVCQQPALNPDLMILADGKNIDNGTGGTCLRISCPIVNIADPRLDNGPGAHDTRLQSHIKLAALQSPAAQAATSLANGHQLGMQRDILPGFPPVAAPGNNQSFPDDDRTDGYFAQPGRPPGFPQGFPHEADRLV